MQMAQRLPSDLTSKEVLSQMQFSICGAVPPLFIHTEESSMSGRQTSLQALGTSPEVMPSATINRMAGIRAKRTGKAKDRMMMMCILDGIVKVLWNGARDDEASIRTSSNGR
jgi:hypothetical protein